MKWASQAKLIFLVCCFCFPLFVSFYGKVFYFENLYPNSIQIFSTITSFKAGLTRGRKKVPMYQSERLCFKPSQLRHQNHNHVHVNYESCAAKWCKVSVDTIFSPFSLILNYILVIWEESLTLQTLKEQICQDSS